MTVLGSENDHSDEAKSGDKRLLVVESAAGFDAAVLPGRARLLFLKKRRSQLTMALVVVFIGVMLAGIFLAVCFVRKVGPFKKHYNGFCPVGSAKFNGRHRVYESYEVTDRYALIHVPRFNFKHGTFDSVRILHVFDKKVTVIQLHGMCFVKPMMKYHRLRNDWFINLRMLSSHHFRTPNRFAHFYLKIDQRQLPTNYLKDEIHHMADAICNNRPVFRLVFKTGLGQSKCHVECNGCDISEQVNILKVINGRKCKVCKCVREDKNVLPLSSNKIDSNCKSIRCENKCANRSLIGCVRCVCVDTEHKKVPSPINDIHIPTVIVNVNENKKDDSTGSSVLNTKFQFGSIKTDKGKVQKTTEQPLFQERRRFQPIFDYDRNIHYRKRSAETGCKSVAVVFEGYTPLDYNKRVALDHIYDC